MPSQSNPTPDAIPYLLFETTEISYDGKRLTRHYIRRPVFARKHNIRLIKHSFTRRPDKNTVCKYTWYKLAPNQPALVSKDF
jgi:hypothetical protein